MSKFIIFFILLFKFAILESQIISFPVDAFDVSVIDSGFVKIWYAFNAIDILDYKTYDDLQILEIGKKQSKYYSFFVYNSDSLVTRWKQQNNNTGRTPTRMGPRGKDPLWSEYYFSVYYKDFANNTLTEYCRMPMPLNKINSYYTEDLPIINWKILSDTMTLAKHFCQKAICSFRGREFIAWFTTDIPINNGPWKFSGLPGLILKVYDTQKLYSFECIKVEQKNNKFPIEIHNNFNNYKKIDRDKLLKLQKDIHEDFNKVANLTPVWGGKAVHRIYYPLELIE